jgi:hypothetical protein
VHGDNILVTQARDTASFAKESFPGLIRFKFSVPRAF